MPKGPPDGLDRGTPRLVGRRAIWFVARPTDCRPRVAVSQSLLTVIRTRPNIIYGRSVSGGSFQVGRFRSCFHHFKWVHDSVYRKACRLLFLNSLLNLSSWPVTRECIHTTRLGDVSGCPPLWPFTDGRLVDSI